MIKITLFDLIDLRETKKCRVRINGTELDVVHLRTDRTDGHKLYAMLASGKMIEVTRGVFDILSERLGEHLRQHIIRK